MVDDAEIAGYVPMEVSKYSPSTCSGWRTCAGCSFAGALLMTALVREGLLTRQAIEPSMVWEKWYGSTVYDGKVYAAPVMAEHIFVFDTVTREVSGIPTAHLEEGTPGGFKWSSMVAYRGKLYAPPLSTHSILVYDPITHHASTIPVGPRRSHGATWLGMYYGICGHGSKLYAGPLNADELLIYDMEQDTISGVSTTAIATGFRKWHGVAEHGGLIYGVPHSADSLLVYDTQTGQISGINISHVETGDLKWIGLTKYGNKLYGAPGAAKSIFVFDIDTQRAFGISLETHSLGFKPYLNLTNKWCDFALLGNSLVAAPYDAVDLLAYTPGSNQVTTIPTDGVSVGPAKWCGGAVQLVDDSLVFHVLSVATLQVHENKLYAAPDHVKVMLVFENITNELSGIDTNSLEKNQF